MMRCLLILSALSVCLSASGQLNVSNPFYVSGLLRSGSCTNAGISIRGIGQTNTTGNASSYTVATSNAPNANALCLVAVINSKASTPDTPTLTGHGMTWVQVAQKSFNTDSTPLTLLTVFRSMTNDTPTSTEIVADFGGVNQSGCNIRAIQLTGTDTNGTYGANAILQTVSGGTDAGTDPAITLSSLTISSNAVVAFIGNDRNGFAGAPEASWTEDWDTGYNTPATGGYCTFLTPANGDNTVVVTSASADWGGLAFEIASRCVSTQGGGGGGGGGFNPSNQWLAIQYDLNAITNTVNGSTIISFPDASSNKWHAATGPVTKPYMTNNGAVMNGKKWAHFNGTSDYIETNFTATVAQPSTAYLVVRMHTTDNDSFFTDGLSARNAVWLTSGNLSLYAGSTMSGSGAGAVNGNWIVMEAVFDGSNSRIRTNNVHFASGSAGTEGLSGLILGAAQSHSAESSMDLAYLLWYGKTNSPTEMSDIHNFLNTNFGGIYP